MKTLRPAITVVALAALVVAASGSTWVVRSGDTLWGIARSADTTVDELVAINDIATPDLIRPGQSLRLPTDTAGPSDVHGDVDGNTDAAAGDVPATGADATDPDAGAAADTADGRAGETHRIEPGDTLYGIARRYATTVSDLIRVNRITDPDRIQVGRDLTIRPDERTPSPEAPPAPTPPTTVTQAEVGALLDRTARQYGVDPALVKAVAWQESRWRNHVVSSAGARGIMQIMPATGRWISGTLAGRTLDLDDPQDNVLAGVLYLRYLGTLTGSNERRLLASYFQGPNAVARHGVSAAGHRYVDQVQAHRDGFR